MFSAAVLLRIQATSSRRRTATAHTVLRRILLSFLVVEFPSLDRCHLDKIVAFVEEYRPHPRLLHDMVRRLSLKKKGKC